MNQQNNRNAKQTADNPSEVSDQKALLLGCRVAGPVLAVFLQRIGVTPVIYEGRSEPRVDAGFFLNLAANGTDVLETLGGEQDHTWEL